MKNKLFLGGIALIVVCLVAMITLRPQMIGAAPLGAPTPVVYANNAGRASAPRIMSFFSGTPIADTTPQRVCYDAPGYSTMDLQWIATPSGVNAVTVLLENSNDNTNYDTGATIINNSSTPVSSMQQYALFGRYHCIKITATNATPAAVFVYGIAK